MINAVSWFVPIIAKSAVSMEADLEISRVTLAPWVAPKSTKSRPRYSGVWAKIEDQEIDGST